MGLIFSESNWNIKLTRTPDCPPDKPRTVESCQVEYGMNSDGQNLTIFIPKQDLDLYALGVEYYMAWLKDSFDEVWLGFKGGLSYEQRDEGFMRTPRDDPYNRYGSNPTNLFNGFGTTHSTTPEKWEPYKLSDFKVKNDESVAPVPKHKDPPANVQPQPQDEIASHTTHDEWGVYHVVNGVTYKKKFGG